MKIKLNGGSSELHMISLNDMKKLADSLQKISYNYEFQTLGTKNREIFIKATKKKNKTKRREMPRYKHFVFHV